ncbi:hypothetical protein HYQ46_009293 [Verticillium longisporum]|nr:hypothetical protein HYQ46_009293 [Verticillium longisporum]
MSDRRLGTKTGDLHTHTATDLTVHIAPDIYLINVMIFQRRHPLVLGPEAQTEVFLLPPLLSSHRNETKVKRFASAYGIKRPNTKYPHVKGQLLDEFAKRQATGHSLVPPALLLKALQPRGVKAVEPLAKVEEDVQVVAAEEDIVLQLRVDDAELRCSRRGG